MMKRYFGVIAVSALLILLVVLAVREKSEPVQVEGADPKTTQGQPQTTQDSPLPSTTLPATSPETQEPPAALVLPRLIFFADNNRGVSDEITSYTSPWINGKDIGAFGVVPVVTTQGAANRYTSFWNVGTSLYPDLAGCTLSYTLHYELTGGEKGDIQLRAPGDTKGDFNQYFDVYLYDDVAGENSGASYIHLEEGDVTDATLITSVKITGRTAIDQVAALTLSVQLVNADGPQGEPLVLTLVKQ